MLTFVHCPPQAKKFWGVFCVKKVPVIHISTLPSAGEKILGLFLCVKRYELYICTQPAAGEKKINLLGGVAPEYCFL